MTPPPSAFDMYVSWYASAHPGASPQLVAKQWRRLSRSERALFELTAADELVDHLLRTGSPEFKQAHASLMKLVAKHRAQGPALSLYDAISPWSWNSTTFL